MFSQEAIKLAKPLVETIKKIAERQEKECPKCKGGGMIGGTKLLQSRYPSECYICGGTGKVKGKWEWKPEWNDKAITSTGTVAQVTMILANGQICLRDRLDKHFYGGRQDGKWVVSGNPTEEIIPLLHWERILSILRDIGYTVGITLGQTSGALVIYHERINTEALHKSMDLSEVQPTVMLAVIELMKELNHVKS